MDRADHKKDNMGLTTWKDAPRGKIQKFDVSVAKNYLTENEMAQLQRLVSAYLDIAEDMALRQIPMTMQDWETRLNRFIILPIQGKLLRSYVLLPSGNRTSVHSLFGGNMKKNISRLRMI